MGNAIFRNIKTLDNVRAGFQVHKSNFTKEEVIFEDSLVVLDSVLNGEIPVENVSEGLQRCGILLSRTDGFLVRNVKIFNVRTDMFQMESSSENQFIKLWNQGGKQVNVQ